MTRRAEVVIANMDLRSLEPDNRAAAVALRDAYETRLTDILRDGAARGLFHIENTRVTTFAFIAMPTGICMWYRPDGPRGQEELIRIHTDLAMRSVTG